MPFEFTALPVWVIATINVAFYAGLIWASVGVYRNADTRERVLVLAWLGVILPIEGLLPPAAAAIQWIKAAGMTAASVAAVMILLQAPARTADPSVSKRGRTIMLGVIVGLLLGGMLLYWIL